MIFLDKIKKKKIWFVLILILIFQYLSSYLLKYDLTRICYGQSPIFSTTFGIVIFDGGSKQYWGPGYTINLSFSGYHADTKISSLYHLSYWYWIPFFNFPWNEDDFFTEDELALNRREWIKQSKN